MSVKGRKTEKKRRKERDKRREERGNKKNTFKYNRLVFYLK